MSPEAEAVGLAQSWNSLSDPAVPMVKGRAGPRSNSSLTDTPACRRTSAGSIATLVCSGLRAGRGPGTVGAGALILLAPPLAHWRTTPPSLYFRVVPLKKGLKPLILRPKKSVDRPLRCCICWGVRSSSKRMRLALRRLEALKALCLADTVVSSTRTALGFF